MGVILHQVDNNTLIVTAAVVDKYGELVAHKDFMHLMPPRKISEKTKEKMNNEEDRERLKKMKMTEKDEMDEHQRDLDKMKQLIFKYQVDLIVVAANKLDAKRIHDTLKELAGKIKAFGLGDEDNQMQDENAHKKNRGDEEEQKKEAIVIWGSLEIPKLFAASHQS